MLDKLLYQYRQVVILSAILCWGYTAFSLWFVVPFADFSAYWQPDDQLVIGEVPEISLARPYLEPGDTILAIDGREVHRSAHIYTTLSKTSYE